MGEVKDCGTRYWLVKKRTRRNTWRSICEIPVDDVMEVRGILKKLPVGGPGDYLLKLYDLETGLVKGARSYRISIAEDFYGEDGVV